jgi:hypothetical protein
MIQTAMYDREGKADPRQATIDHVVPLSNGGTNDEDNLVLACRECNQLRGCGNVKLLANQNAVLHGTLGNANKEICQLKKDVQDQQEKNLEAGRLIMDLEVEIKKLKEIKCNSWWCRLRYRFRRHYE